MVGLVDLQLYGVKVDEEGRGAEGEQQRVINKLEMAQYKYITLKILARSNARANLLYDI
jgi:hypothetical protein